jgi:hypothetical protein
VNANAPGNPGTSTVAAPMPLHDPRRTERVGSALARQLNGGDGSGVTAVVCWNSSEDIVLAHVVARELGVELRLADEAEGIITLAAPLTPRDTVAIVGENLEGRNAVGGLAGVVDHVGARVTAVATVEVPAEVAGTTAESAAVLTVEGQ